MQYGNTVVYVIGDQSVKALVLHSSAVGGDEQLVLAHLDPKHSNSEVLSGTQMQEAIKFAFGVAPIKEGLVNGWKPDQSEPGFFVKFQDLLELSNAVIANDGSDLEVCPDAVPSSATTVIHRLADKLAATLAQRDALILANNARSAENLSLTLTVRDLQAKQDAAKEAEADKKESDPELTVEDVEKLKQLSGTGGLAAQPGGDVMHETKHYADGSSATGPAPLPDHSPEGAPEILDMSPINPPEEFQHTPEQPDLMPAVPELPPQTTPEG